ncbi:genomic scaffold, msy-sf-9 protein, putative [Rhizoctonia solani AG-3 Rhs1AP]|uniref:Genomic scaffold, msy-sf-9 protein, putative n=2 Tax=Rhizoctonia solani AG-3 TaxID=1086053 RepID=X8IXJ0_9AGAM|nr:genomic scaffold, msy-sf-9 protein, putative [Rhizoctonia solani AG-3 Rhs1AP]KEP47199.1 putative genomic scaffold, msy-sf-9 protein [Rhizoctonia solani 123E]
MAKSTRSKSKRAFRRHKREDGVYAATDAARLQRLSAKLAAKISADKDGDQEMGEEEDTEQQVEGGESAAPKKISTSGPRGSRREEWRKSKGMSTRSKHKNRMNKHGVVASSRRAGVTKRRR